MSQVATLIALIWLVSIADFVVPFSLTSFGLAPRTVRGLLGIPLMTFLHGGLGHLISNTIPLAVLLTLTVASRERAWHAIIAIVLVGGILLWLLGRSANHVGASLLIFGLITFLVTVGIREKQIVSLSIALSVGFLFGGSLLWGVIPSLRSGVSWDGHLCGAIAGVLVGINTASLRILAEPH